MDENSLFESRKFYDIELLRTEYSIASNEVSRIKNNQISILVAAISSSILILAFILNFFGNSITNGNGVNEVDCLIFLSPMAVIIPLMVLFYEKLPLYSIKIAFLRTFESILHGSLIIVYYSGYNNLLKTFYSIKAQDKPSEDICRDTSLRGKIGTVANHLKSNYFLLSCNPIYNYSRFWIISFYGFLGIILLCIGLTLYVMAEANCLGVLSTPLIAWVCISLFFISIILYIVIYSLSYYNNIEKIQDFQNFIFLIIGFYLSLRLYLGYIDAFGNNDVENGLFYYLTEIIVLLLYSYLFFIMAILLIIMMIIISAIVFTKIYDFISRYKNIEFLESKLYNYNQSVIDLSEGELWAKVGGQLINMQIIYLLAVIIGMFRSVYSYTLSYDGGTYTFFYLSLLSVGVVAIFTL